MRGRKRHSIKPWGCKLLLSGNQEAQPLWNPRLLSVLCGEEQDKPLITCYPMQSAVCCCCLQTDPSPGKLCSLFWVTEAAAKEGAGSTSSLHALNRPCSGSYSLQSITMKQLITAEYVDDAKHHVTAATFVLLIIL